MVYDGRGSLLACSRGREGEERGKEGGSGREGDEERLREEGGTWSE